MTEAPFFLYGTAASIALMHTLLGPDHYLPFMAMSRAGRWSLSKTVFITVLCGVGHVLSSVFLGLIGIVFGVAVFRLESFESFRGDLVGFLMIGFGLIYFVWGVRHAIRNRPHTHWHVHADGTIHTHEHTHSGQHLHVHAGTQPGAQATGVIHDELPMNEFSKDGAVRLRRIRERNTKSDQSFKPDTSLTLTPWILFTIFLFGPCELLIPVLMYPAARAGVWLLVGVILVFGVTTIVTMTLIVAAAHFSLNRMFTQRVSRFQFFQRFNRYSHALAGVTILFCGTAVLMGL